MSELLNALRAYDNKATTILSEANTRLGESADFTKELATFIDSQEAFVANGATWLIKHRAESGIVPKPGEVVAIVSRLDAVNSWQAALHLCQSAELLPFTPDQARQFAEWAVRFLEHERPFLRAWSMSAIQCAAQRAPDLAKLAQDSLAHAEKDEAASVRARARKIRAAT